MNQILIICLVFISLLSCVTTEEVERKKEMSSLSLQVEEGQKISTEALTRLSDIEQKVSQLQGSIEEVQFNEKTKREEQVNVLNQRIESLEKQNSKYQETISSLEAKMEQQTKFIKQVTSELSKLAGPSKTKSVSRPSKQSKKLNKYDEAMQLYKKGKYKRAQEILVDLSSSKNLPSSKKARVIHNLGMIAYIYKKYDESTTHFSKVFTKFPKSGYVPNSLLYLGKTFQATKQVDLAKETFKELINKFPNGKHAKKAKNILNKM